MLKTLIVNTNEILSKTLFFLKKTASNTHLDCSFDNPAVFFPQKYIIDRHFFTAQKLNFSS